MNWKFQNNRTHLEDENGNLICVFADNASSHDKAVMRYAPELYDAILQFSLSIETTKSPRNPKKHYENFQRLLDIIVTSGEE